MKNIDMVKVRLVPDYKLRSDVPIATSADAIQLLKEELSLLDREALCVLNLNAKAKPINASIVSIGDANSTTVHPREVFKCAVLSSAAGIVIIHNHPSGDVEPSDLDISVTGHLISAGKVLGIRVIDHLIIGPNAEYYSMLDKGLIKEMEEMSKESLLAISQRTSIQQLEGKDDELSKFKILRVINDVSESIPLTRDEVCSVYFEQQREFDRETIVGYLEEVGGNPKESQIFKLKHDISVKKVLSSEAILQRLTAEFRRQKNKQGMDESVLLEDVLEKELADIPKRTRRTKELER